MRDGHRWLLLLACLMALVLARPGEAVAVGQRGNQVLINGQPTPITFARGCTDPAVLPAYHALGLNTLLVRVESPAPAALDRADALCEAAEQEGLNVLIELANGNWASGRRAALSDPKYLERAEYFLKTVLQRLQPRKNLLGWVVNTVQDGALISDGQTLSEYLQGKYGTIAALNEAWGYVDGNGKTIRSRVPSFRVLSEKTVVQLSAPNAHVRQIVQRDLEEFKAAQEARDKDFQEYLRTQYVSIDELNDRWEAKFATWDDVGLDLVFRRQKEDPKAPPMPRYDAARYQMMVPRTLMDWWASQLRQRDAAHLVFAGNQQTYRTIINVPVSVHGMVTACYPGVAEADRESHNPHAIDMARRGNQFIVLAGIQARNATPDRFAAYLYEAALHGAAGLEIADWPLLVGSAAHARMLQVALADMRQRQLLCRAPMPRVAFVYSPYTLGPPMTDRPLYGYLTGHYNFGPGLFFFTMRHGTGFGQIDYLAAEDLPRVGLTRYNTLLLPAVFDLPKAAQEALYAYVESGGTVLADLGLGAVQMLGNAHFLPPRMAELFGLINVPDLTDVRMNLEVYRMHPRFPLLVQGQRTTGLMNGYMITRAARNIPVPGTDLLFQTVGRDPLDKKRPPDRGKPQQPGMPRPPQVLKREPMRGMFVTQRGKGLALYCNFALYQHWIPQTLLFEQFHRDLLGAGAEVTFERPTDLLPPRAEIAAFEDGSVMLWTKDATPPVARVRNPVMRGYATPGGRCEIAPEATTLTFATAGFFVAQALPIFLDLGESPFPVTFNAVQVTPQGLVFDLEVSEALAERTLTVHLTSGVYPIAPNSTHHLTVLMPSGWREETVQADARGQLTLPAVPARSRILVQAPDTLVDVRQATPEPPRDANGDLIIEAVPEPKR